MAITDEDASDGDGRASVDRRDPKLLIAALIMHLPAHRPHSQDLGTRSTDLGQCVVSRRGVLPGDPRHPHSSRGHAPRRAVPFNSGAPSKAWFRDAYHLFGSKSSPCVATVGAHFAALTETHRVRNPIVACGMLRKDWMRGGTGDTIFSAALACSRRAIIASVCLRSAATASRWASKPPTAASGKPSGRTSC